MGAISGFANTVMRRLRAVSIFTRIVVANTVIIAGGAIAGTLLIRHLTGISADLRIILLVALVGILFSAAINGWLIRSALRPLRELSQAVEQIQAGQDAGKQYQRIPRHLLEDADPHIWKLSKAIDHLVTQLRAHNLRLRALSERALNAQEEERKRIARSLHDDTGQALSILIINLERLENRLPELSDELKTRLMESHQLATNTLTELRKIVQGLRPSILDDLGLVPAIRWYARSNLEGAGIRVEMRGSEEIGPLSPRMKSTLFRIAQEAINNIVRHSQAHTAVITLNQNDREICLQVEDDGLGFDVSHISEQSMRQQKWGLVGIVERAELVGGEVNLVSEPGIGTLLQVTVPRPEIEEVSDG